MSEELQIQYYLVIFKVLQREYYTIWYTDDMDGFLLDPNGMLKSFPSKENAASYAEKEGFILGTADEYPISAAILKKANTQKIDCNLFLNYWNIFSDVAHSINCRFLGDHRENESIHYVYEKLFYGCNLLVKEDEDHYRPKWNRKERYLIAKVMKNGFMILSKGLNIC